MGFILLVLAIEVNGVLVCVAFVRFGCGAFLGFVRSVLIGRFVIIYLIQPVFTSKSFPEFIWNTHGQMGEDRTY